MPVSKKAIKTIHEFYDWMDTIVGKCDVCHSLLTRAEVHLMNKEPNGFGCFIGCKRRMGRATP